MFLFLSKLLPLFVYPVGLVCLLLLGAMLTYWKRPRFAGGCVGVALLVVLLAGNGWVADALARSLEWQYLPSGELPQVAAIVVLGGSTKSPVPPRPWVDLSEEGDRILHGAQLFRQGKAPVVILSGGRIYWRGSGSSESMDMAAVIETMGVPSRAILQDPASLNTRENAVNVQQILQQQQIQGPILLVTSAMHMPRSMAVFRKLGMDAIAAPTDFQVTFVREDQGVAGFVLQLLPDADALAQTTKVLKEYLGLLIYRLRGWI